MQQNNPGVLQVGVESQNPAHQVAMSYGVMTMICKYLSQQEVTRMQLVSKFFYDTAIGRV